MTSARARRPRMGSALALVVCLLALVVGAVLAIRSLQADATASRDAEKQLVTLRLYMTQIQDVPWGAAPDNGDDPADVRDELIGDVQQIDGIIDDLDHNEGLPDRAAIVRPFRRATAALWQIFAAVRSDQDTGTASEVAAVQVAKADTALQKAALGYRARSVHSLRVAEIGSAAVIVLLFGGFAVFYWRSAQARRSAQLLADENRQLAVAHREAAITDALTGLRNRRALTEDLDRAEVTADSPLLLVLFDLNGFKHYNDNFGHPAGDALLARLGQRLAGAMHGVGTAYRMGGDEFCVLAPAHDEIEMESVISSAVAALSETGPGFAVGCGFGAALIPMEAAKFSDAMHLADRRLYANKDSGRVPASRQTTDALRTLLAERVGGLGQRGDIVAAHAGAVAALLGLPNHEIDRIRLAAELHDIGKAAVPDAILTKPGPLDDEEWSFMHRHPVIAERIVSAAASLTPTADLVRYQAERIDGTGYPDGLAGDAIPLGARIVAVCAAFAAMTGERPYRRRVSTSHALAELRRCAASQFDPRVVAAFCAVVEDSAVARPVVASGRRIAARDAATG